jgi:hypothetical protein
MLADSVTIRYYASQKKVNGGGVGYLKLMFSFKAVIYSESIDIYNVGS